jgi:ribosomal protein S6--L-glutamate ligase
LTRYGYGAHDAYVLKTVSDGPGMTLLDAAAAVGIATVNNARAIRLVRDKAVAAAFARRHDIPFPLTYFVAQKALLETIPDDYYPLVIKPSNGSSCRGVFRVAGPDELASLAVEVDDRFFLAQRYVDNAGVDIKLYNTGTRVFAVHKRSPLHPGAPIVERLVALEPELERLTVRVGEVFGLDIYGIDVVQTPAGWMVLDINDFPSFGMVPDAAGQLAATIERIAARAAADRQRSYLERIRLPMRDRPATSMPRPRAGPQGPATAET